MRVSTFVNYFIFLLVLCYSCKPGLVECKNIQEWKSGKFTFSKSDCIGPAGPHYYPISVYVDGEKQPGNASHSDSCIFSWQANSESHLTINICDGSIQERRPDKVPLNPLDIDSITIFSEKLRLTQKFISEDVERFAMDWNSSKTRGYYPEEPFESAFSHNPAFQYMITIYSRGQERSFYAYNYIVLDSSSWKYEMSRTGDLQYIRSYWRN